MIDVTESQVRMRPGTWFEVWSDLGGRYHIIGDGVTCEAALIGAEHALRSELDRVQAELTAERDRPRQGQS